jgi:hypothetical protein
MAGNVIFRGPIERQYRTVERPVTGALVPGSWVEDTGTALAQITTALGKRALVLAPMDPKGQPVTEAYVSGDTGLAIEVQANDVVQARMAAATYAKGAPLTVAASGRLAAATAGTRVVAFFDDTPGAYAAGDLADVIVADGYIVPA